MSMSEDLKNALEIFRQGDVVLMRLQDTPEGVIPGDVTYETTLKHGEASGTKHVLRGLHRLIKDGEDAIVIVGSDGASLLHEGEKAHHLQLRIPPGAYRFLRGVPRELREGEIRPVTD